MASTSVKQIASLINDGIAKNIPKRPWSWPDIVKINTPWHVMAPKDVKFLIIPLPYTPFFDFEACLGILDPILKVIAS